MILTPEEKRLGCMLVDMGAETTTVSIYKEGHLVYFAKRAVDGSGESLILEAFDYLLGDFRVIGKIDRHFSACRESMWWERWRQRPQRVR